MFNNADGNYEASFKSNIVIYADGELSATKILWVPPAIYKSSCTIDVTYFPFDEQWCEMRFGSWTFDANQVRLIREKPMANLDDYLPSGTWDVIEAPSEEIEYMVDGVKRMELVYKFRIRRKTLFYTVNLIIPTVLISFLSIFVFYLPTDEGEKMTLCISILLALVVFLLLVSKILPPTSIVIPLIAKYLLFTLIMNIVTILNTVIIINWNYRTPRTHNMPRWVRVVFTEFLPKILFMKRRINPDKNESNSTTITNNASFINKNNSNYSIRSRPPSIKSNSTKLINSVGSCEYETNSINKRNSKKFASSSTLSLTSNRQNKNDHEKTQRTSIGHQKQQQHLNLSDQVIKKKKKINNNFNAITTTGELISSNSLKRSVKIAFDKSDSDEQILEQNEVYEEFNQEILDAADKVAYITNHIKSENDYQEVSIANV